jgi:hypothetical protein
MGEATLGGLAQLYLSNGALGRVTLAWIWSISPYVLEQAGVCCAQ